MTDVAILFAFTAIIIIIIIITTIIIVILGLFRLHELIL
jgi:hypothetical protein